MLKLSGVKSIQKSCPKAQVAVIYGRIRLTLETLTARKLPPRRSSILKPVTGARCSEARRTCQDHPLGICADRPLKLTLNDLRGGHQNLRTQQLATFTSRNPIEHTCPLSGSSHEHCQRFCVSRGYFRYPMQSLPIKP